jgi:hypothetical protein
MRMRTELLDAVGAGLPWKGDNLHGAGERTIWPDGQHPYVARTIIGHHQKAAAGSDGLMHAIAAAGFGAVQRLQETGRAIHRKRSGIGFIAVHRIEVAPIRGHHQE